VILDEAQKVPQLLDEVHWLIENRGLRFILCGSSARKLKRGRTNLLGGRAERYEMHPLVSAEVGGLDLLRALNRGLVPAHYLSAGYRRSLEALKEEVFGEGLARHRSHRDLHYPVHFWRTKSGLEVDFVLGDGEVAVEVEGKARVDPADSRSLRAFRAECRPRRAIVVCHAPAPRVQEGLEVLPWRVFLRLLWAGEVIR
jgi:predicted AAA+ superfamily ATPase